MDPIVYPRPPTAPVIKRKTVDPTIKRSALEGVSFGLIAGIVFAIAFVIAETAMGNPPLTPFRLIASIAYGPKALSDVTLPIGNALLVGSLIHFAFSALFGLIYGLLSGRLSADLQTAWGKQAAYGAVYGVALWLINFQLIARWRFPWMLDQPQFLVVLLHAAFYGLPLAVMYVAAERKAHHLPMGPTQPVM